MLMCLKQSFLRFSGSCEVKRKACFRLRGKKTHHSFVPPGSPGGLAVYIWHSLCLMKEKDWAENPAG